MKRAIEITVGLLFLFLWVSLAQAVITTVDVAEVIDGVAVVAGTSDQPNKTPITWEGLPETTLSKKGKFSFAGVVPADCEGELSDGVDTILVPLANCVVAPPPAPAGGVPQTGQTTCWNTGGAVIACAGTGQDGDVLAGVALPQPRFTDNGDGTITDNLTGLIWLKDANCFGARTWAQALADAALLADGQCGLTDGSVAGDWVLPNIRQLSSLPHFEFFDPSLSNAAGTGQATAGDPFSNFIAAFYWSSTTVAVSPSFAWVVHFSYGNVSDNFKTDNNFVLLVRSS